MKKKENIYNIPNTITSSRVLLTLVLFYLIFANYSVIFLAVTFAIAMFTDFLDGYFARKLKQETKFGRKFDMISDRFLMIGVVIALLIHSRTDGVFTSYHLLQILLVMTRELLAFPFVVFVLKGRVPNTKFIGKLTTFMQGITFPMILLSTTYPIFNISIYFAIATAIVGAFSAITFIRTRH